MVGRSIKKLRQESNLTQRELASILGVSRQAICMWEANKREPDIATLNKMARLFNVTLDKIVTPHEVAVMGKEVEEMIMRTRQKKAIEVKKKEEDMVKNIRKRLVDFEIMAPQASRVIVTGDFNSWDESSVIMRRSKNGLWKTALNLAPGRYEYKFIVDGQWWTDPANDNINTNSLGTQNSVREISL